VAKALAKGSRITGEQRSTLGTEYAERYNAGESIRTIAEDAGRSFGFVHGVLKESGVALRGRGGATRGAARAAAEPPVKEATAKKATAKKTTAKKGPATKASATKKATAKKASAQQSGG
jgi:hypothetical protein